MSHEREPIDRDAALDARLAAALPAPPPGLADAIMRGVRDEARRRQQGRRRTRMLVAGAATLVAAAAALLLWLQARPAVPARWRVSASDGDTTLTTGAALRDGQRLEVAAGGYLRLALDDSRAVRLDGGAAAITYPSELRLLHGRAHLEGRARITTTWARVVGISDDAQAELTLDDDGSDGAVEHAHANDKENAHMLSAKGSLILAATAGSVLTVAVLRGRAEVRPTADGPAVTLAAGDRMVLPPDGLSPVPAKPDRPPVGAGVIARHAPDESGAVPVAPGKVVNAGEPECPPSPPDCEGDDCPKCDQAVVIEDSDQRFKVNPSGPALGPDDAKVLIVEFSDYQCPFCEKALSTIHQLAGLYPNDVRIVYKNFPIPSHKDARLAAEAALAAGEQGKYWEMHDVLFANQEHLDRAALESYAANLGLDLPRFRAALDDHRHVAQIDRDFAEGQGIGVQGVPSFVINGRVIAGARPLEELKQIVEDELKAAQ